MTATITPTPNFAPAASPTNVEIIDADGATVLASSVPFVAQSARVDDPLSNHGVLELQVGIDETAAEHIGAGNLLRLTIDGEYVFRAEIEAPIRYQRVHIDGAAREVASLSCRGEIASLETVPVLPRGGVGAQPQSTQRPMTWCSPEADISGLDPATVLYEQLAEPWETPQTDPPWFAPWYPPKGYPDPTTKHIWSSTPDPETGHPPQTRRFVRDVTISTEGWYQFWGFADDGLTVYVDGLRCIEGNEDPGDTFIIPVTFPIYFTAGTHRIGIEAYNYPRPVIEAVGTFGGPNIGRIGWSLYYLPDGTNTVLAPELLVAHSDENTLTLDTDDPLPAPTWGKILRTFKSEAPAGSPADRLTFDFTDTLDSNGNPWTPQGDQLFGTDNDTGLLAVVQQGASSGCIDWHCADGVLSVTNYGEMGSVHAAAYTRANGTLTDLQETTIAGRVSGLVVRHNKGLATVDDSATATEIGTRRRVLALGNMERDAAIAAAGRELDIRKQDRSSFVAAIEPAFGSTAMPYASGGPRVGDTPSFEGDPARIVRLSTTFDAAGYPIIVPELQTRLQGDAERQRIAASKLGATLDSTARAAAPTPGMSSGIVAGFAKPIEPLVFTQVQLTPTGYEAMYDVSNSRKWEDVNVARVHRIDLRQDVPPQTTATVVDVIKSGPGGSSTVATLTLPVGTYRVVELPEYLHVGLLEQLHIVVTDHDTAVQDPDNPELDARWLKLEVFAIDANPAATTPKQTEVPW